MIAMLCCLLFFRIYFTHETTTARHWRTCRTYPVRRASSCSGIDVTRTLYMNDNTLWVPHLAKRDRNWLARCLLLFWCLKNLEYSSKVSLRKCWRIRCHPCVVLSPGSYCVNRPPAQVIHHRTAISAAWEAQAKEKQREMMEGARPSFLSWSYQRMSCSACFNSFTAAT